MDKIHSTSGFNGSQTSSAVERLHDTAENNTSFPPVTYERNPASATASFGRTMETSTPRTRFVDEPDTELYDINAHLNQPRTAEPEFSLPPVDGGKEAWFFLSSAFVLEIFVWGTTPTASAPN
jgi:hypothetical protein